MNKKVIALLAFLNVIAFADKQISLISSLYNETNEERFLEYITCLEKNLNNELINDIHIIYDFSRDDHVNKLLSYLHLRPVTVHYFNGPATYGFCFQLAQDVCEQRKVILTHPDIYFDETLSYFEHYDLADKFIALTRYSSDKNEDFNLGINKEVELICSQDAWIFQRPLSIFQNNTLKLEILLSTPITNQTVAQPPVEKNFSSVLYYHLNQDNIPIMYSSDLPEMPTITYKKKELPLNILLPTTAPMNGLPFINTKGTNKFGLETAFLKAIAKVFNASHFIETGTHKGDTLKKAESQFKTIDSIEIDPHLANAARIQFEQNPKITIHQGDSPHVLEKLLPHIDEKIIVFLDAHYIGGNTVKGKANNPILDELDAIRKSGITNAIIIIDDARFFYDPLHPVKNLISEGFPTLNHVVEKILQINPQYQFACIHDSMIAYTDKIMVTPVVRACTMSRLYDGINFEASDVIRAEKIIGKANHLEKETIKNLAQNYTEPWGKRPGLCRHYPLWYGLILFENKEYQAALAQFKEAYDRGLTHWRVQWYMSLAQSHLEGNI